MARDHNPVDRPLRFARVQIRPWLLSWLPVAVTLVIGGGTGWAVLALHRAADRTRDAQVTLVEIQRNVQNAENLFSKASSLTLPKGSRGGPASLPPPGGLPSAGLEANNLGQLAALRSTSGDRSQISVVSRELAALNETLRPLSGSMAIAAGIARGQRIVPR